MSASVTQCPQCSTRFKVSDEQLATHNGMVRCGRCSNIFNATQQLHDDQPSPQLDLPIAIQEEEITADISAEHTTGKSPIEAIADEQEALEHQFQLQEEIPDEHIAAPTPRQRHWPWIVASLLLLLALLAQALYFYRIEISARLPGLKPALTNYCHLLQCTIPLPRKADLMSIEASDLEGDPQQANIISLSAVLRNRATYTQAYPSLELSLTDLQDKVLTRRTFAPPDYLKTGTDEKSGLAGNHEISIKLWLDTADIKPTGYKLLLLYP